MRCTNSQRRRQRQRRQRQTRFALAIILLATCVLFGTAFVFLFGNKPYNFTYDGTKDYYQSANADWSNKTTETFSKNLCIVNENISNPLIDDLLIPAGGLFSIDTGTTLYAKNVHQPMNPASITKILTALVALEKGSMEDIITVSDSILSLDVDSSICGLRVGDQLSLQDALYGLMLNSGNDAAVAIAEHVGGSQEQFMKMMNEKAISLGATNSHFTNPHGLTDEEHYTTVYDIYLILNAALQNPEFVDIIETTEYTANCIHASGEKITLRFDNTNQYLTGEISPPDSIHVLGGKTGTTMAAGSCLALVSQDSENHRYISILLKLSDRWTLYSEMNKLLEIINK